ncbi:MAG TPA: tetratricopeptide repeat protein [Terracidiphilus sp.]|nr:tetratricopeptide repeat protein [Terracidiphilus sp.]
MSSVQEGDFAGAVAASNLALKTDPNDSRVWTLRGMAYAGLQNEALAQAAFEHALKLAPHYLPALEGEAQLKYKRGDDGARTYLLRVLTVRPDDPTTHGMLAVLDYRKRDCSGAVAHFKKAGEAITSQPDGMAMYGRCLATMARYEEAIPVLEQSLSLDPTQHGTRYNLALCEWNAGKNQAALATLEPLLASDQGDERALELAAGVDEALGDSQSAIDLLRKAILANPKSPGAYLQFAELTYEHGSPKIGIDFLNAGLTQLPKEARLYLVRGVLLCQLGEFEKAFEDFQAADRLDPELSYVDVAKGIVQSQVHKPAEALAQFRAAAKEHPEEALAQYLFAEALSEQGKPEIAEAIGAASRAVRLDPKLVEAQDLLAGIYLEQGERRWAIEHSEAALAVDPKDQQALYHLILALRDSDRKAEIPELMKRMKDLAEEHKGEDGPQKRLHQLYELPETK